MLITLLDMIVRNRGGSPPGPGVSALEGLLGIGQGGQRTAPQQQPQQSAPRQRRGPNPDFLSRLMGTVGGPEVSQDQRQQVNQQGLVSAGLGTLMSDPSQGTLPRLAQGIAAGRQITSQMQQAIEKDQEERARALEMMSVFGEGPLTRDNLRKGIRLAAIRGDDSTVDSLRGVLEAMPETPEDEGMNLVTIKGAGSFLMDENHNFYNPFTKERVTVPPEPGGEEDPFSGAFTDTVFGGAISPRIAQLAVEQGLVQSEAGLEEIANQGVKVRFNQAGEPIRVLGIAASEGGADAPGGRQARVMRRNLETLKTIIDEKGVPNRAHDLAPNELKPEWVQQYEAAAGNVNINAASLTFKGRVSDSERDALSRVLVPKPGDDEATIRQKMKNLEQMIRDFERQAGIFDPNRQPGSGEDLSRYGVDPNNVDLEGSGSTNLRSGDFGFGGGQ